MWRINVFDPNYLYLNWMPAENIAISFYEETIVPLMYTNDTGLDF